MASSPHLYTGIGAATALFLTAAGAGCASVPAGLFALKAKGSTPVSPFIPIVQGGVLAIYGVIIGVILALQMEKESLTEAQGYQNLAAGLSVGLSCLAAGLGMGRFIDRYMEESSVKVDDTQSPTTPNDSVSASSPLIAGPSDGLVITKGMIMVMIFMESIGLYGLIVALFLSHAK